MRQTNDGPQTVISHHTRVTITITNDDDDGGTAKNVCVWFRFILFFFSIFFRFVSPQTKVYTLLFVFSSAGFSLPFPRSPFAFSYCMHCVCQLFVSSIISFYLFAHLATNSHTVSIKESRGLSLDYFLLFFLGCVLCVIVFWLIVLFLYLCAMENHLL